MNPNKPVATRETLVALCRKRESALELIAHAEKALEDAGTLIPMPYRLSVEIEYERRPDDVRRAVDRRFWRHAIELTGFRQIMDAHALDDWDRQVESRECPEFTEDTVLTTFLAASQEAPAMWDRGVYRVFRRLDASFRSNTADAFQVLAHHRYVLAYYCDGWSGAPQVRHERWDEIDDIDRIVRVARGEPFVARSLETALNAAFKDGETFEDDLYKARGFQNGNLHLWLKDANAVEKINEAIARHTGGNAIPQARAA